jgi:DNA polymerase
MVHHLSIDLETYSDAPIAKTGAQRYIADPSFEILLFAYSLDGAPVQVIDLAQGEQLPTELETALTDPNYIKHAYNATFEFGCLSKAYGPMVAEQWRCTMLHSLYCGYAGSLEATGKALGLPEDKQKLSTGKALIRYFCVPCKPTKVNGGRTRNLPYHDPDKWALFKEYNAQDVVTEMEIERRLSAIPVPDFVQKQWETDLAINRRGVAVDMPLVDGALRIGDAVKKDLMEEARALTQLDNPNSVPQVMSWLNKASEDTTLTDLRKATVAELLHRDDLSPEVQRMLEIRQELGKTSTKKYDAIAACVCEDNRVRGLLQFYGANRTGRWAGRLVQVQNLPRTYTQAITVARRLVREEKADALRLIYGSVPDTLSQLIRTAFIATPGNVLIDADFSAIEARVISWLAGEDWRLNVFRTHGKIYEASASQMFGVPLEKIKKGNPEYALRAKGKVAELALGYQGSTGALITMGALSMGLTEEELPEIVGRWRNANQNIVSLWWEMNDAALQVIDQGGVRRVHCVTLAREYDSLQGRNLLTIALPSGRKLYYVDPQLGENRFGGDSITYLGVDQGAKKWKRIETYGGKLVENCVQAIARDALAEAIQHLEEAGFPIVFHIHDEVVIDIKPFSGDREMLRAVTDIMTKPIPWAPGLPLGADGWVGGFFTKD